MESIDNLQRRPSESNAAREKFSSQNAGDGKILKIIPKIIIQVNVKFRISRQFGELTSV